MTPLVLALAVILASVTDAAAQTADEPGFVIGAGNAGLGIGDVPRLDGLRLNFRDGALERVRGVNVTIWGANEELAEGRVQGLALGVPLTGARTLEGVGVGAGLAVFEDYRGVGVALLGMGAGRDLEGIHLGGLGLGAGRSLRGIAAGGLGMGVGRDAAGILLGGLGMGVGEDLEGLAVGGLGGGIGGDLSGVFVGGLGGGIGGRARGIVIGGLGAGVGGDLSGIGIGGLGLGVGGEVRGLTLTGLGVGAQRIRGVALSGVGTGALELDGATLALAFVQVGSGDEWGELEGVAVSAFNWVRGSQRGLTIGLLNIAEELHGLQVGLINIARNKESFSVLPIANWSR